MFLIYLWHIQRYTFRHPKQYYTSDPFGQISYSLEFSTKYTKLNSQHNSKLIQNKQLVSYTRLFHITRVLWEHELLTVQLFINYSFEKYYKIYFNFYVLWLLKILYYMGDLVRDTAIQVFKQAFRYHFSPGNSIKVPCT